MKKINFYLSFIAVFALLFTSCSKDEESGVNPDSDKATLSFGAIVQDLANKGTNKQSVENMPVCTDDTAAYVEIVLMQGDTEVVGSEAEPERIDLVAGQLFTEEDSKLELIPGDYSLEHFSVYNEAGDLIWLAPKGGVLAQFVDNALPLDISLGAGVKKYVDVSVLCYDDRNVNEYGYMFFELDVNEAFEYCFFANYCTPEGRHYPARYSVDISIDGEMIYSGELNYTDINEDGDFYAEPRCFALPDLAEYEDDEEYIDYTLTLLDWDEAYGDVEQMEISGSLSRNEIIANFEGENNVEYEHVRFGCDDDTTPPMDSDNDGVVDSNDNCPNVANENQLNTDGDELGDACDPDDDNDGINDDMDECPLEAGPESNNGCPVQETDSDNDGFVDSVDNCPDIANVDQADADNDGVGDVCDNCVNTANTNQTDSDNDGVGDACETTVVEECIAEPAAGCNTSAASNITLTSLEDKILVIDYATITVGFSESGEVQVGVTPRVPYEISDVQVYLPGQNEIVCETSTEPSEGVSASISGDFSSTLPLDVEVKVNYCDVSGD